MQSSIQGFGWEQDHPSKAAGECPGREEKGEKEDRKCYFGSDSNEGSLFRTYNSSWGGSQHTIEHQRGDEAFFLCPRVRLH